jgi:hypothetical protein
MAESANVLKPRAPGPGERIQDLDVLRGFALFGIVFINIYQTLGMRDLPTGLALFVQARFYVIFSLLFGIGFAIFRERATARSDRPRVPLVRRFAHPGGRSAGGPDGVAGRPAGPPGRARPGRATRPDTIPDGPVPSGWIVLGGELAVPCTRNPL